MRDLKSLFVAVKVALLIIWPVSAFAATQTLGLGLASVSLLSIAMTLLLSSLSGLTALLHHMKKDLERNGHINHLSLYISSKMFGSNTAGLLSLFWLEDRLDPNLQAGVIIIAAFGGTWFLERIMVAGAEKFFPIKEKQGE